MILNEQQDGVCGIDENKLQCVHVLHGNQTTCATLWLIDVFLTVFRNNRASYFMLGFGFTKILVSKINLSLVLFLSWDTVD